MNHSSNSISISITNGAKEKKKNNVRFITNGNNDNGNYSENEEKLLALVPATAVKETARAAVIASTMNCRLCERDLSLLYHKQCIAVVFDQFIKAMMKYKTHVEGKKKMAKRLAKEVNLVKEAALARDKVKQEMNLRKSRIQSLQKKLQILKDENKNLKNDIEINRNSQGKRSNNLFLLLKRIKEIEKNDHLINGGFTNSLESRLFIEENKRLHQSKIVELKAKQRQLMSLLYSVIPLLPLADNSDCFGIGLSEVFILPIDFLTLTSYFNSISNSKSTETNLLRQKVDAGLGIVVFMLDLLSKYWNFSFQYPVNFFGSKSTISYFDENGEEKRFPLYYCKEINLNNGTVVEYSSFTDVEQAVLLLGINVKMFCNQFGIDANSEYSVFHNIRNFVNNIVKKKSHKKNIKNNNNNSNNNNNTNNMLISSSTTSSSSLTSSIESTLSSATSSFSSYITTFSSAAIQMSSNLYQSYVLNSINNNNDNNSNNNNNNNNLTNEEYDVDADKDLLIIDPLNIT